MGRKRHIGLQFRRLLSRKARHVEGIFDAAIDQIVGHLFGDLNRDIDLSLAGRCTEMRCADQVWSAEQGIFLCRFFCKNVQRSASDMTRFQRILQGRLVDQAAACTVDDPDAGFGFRKRFRRQDVACLVGERRVHGDKVGAGEQIVQRDFFDTHFNRTLLGQEGVIGDNLHPQAYGALGDNGADIAGTDESQRLAGQFDAHELRLFPFAGLGGGIGRGKLTGQGEHQGNRMFGRGDAVAEWRVHDHDALGGSSRDIDIVDSDTGAADHLEVGCCRQYLRGDCGRRADCETVIFADDLHQFFGRLAGDFVDFATALAKNLGGLRVHFVGYENFWHILNSLWGLSGRRRLASNPIYRI